jgi:hypothetical protein
MRSRLRFKAQRFGVTRKDQNRALCISIDKPSSHNAFMPSKTLPGGGGVMPSFSKGWVRYCMLA